MKSKRFVPAYLAALAVVILGIGCSSYQAHREMAEGMKQYQWANYKSAIPHFRAAVALDDDWIGAKFALAGACAGEYVPGVHSPDNDRVAQEAVETLVKILERDPQNANAMKNLAILYMQMGNWDQAGEYSKKAIAASPDDPQPYYLLGVNDWTSVYKDVKRRKAEHGLSMDAELGSSPNSRHLCTEIRAGNQARVDEGLAMLAKAIDKKQNYDDAMAYTSLLYQRKADMECGNPQARLEDLRLSEKWIDEGLAARRRMAANPQPVAKRDLGDELETGTLRFLPPPPPPPPDKQKPSR